MKRKLLLFVYQPYKWLIFFPLLIVNTLLFGVLAVIVSTLVNQKIGSYIGGVLWARFNALTTPMFVKVSGRENIKKGTSYIIVPNHQSMYDIFLIYGWIPLDLKWIMKKELAKVPGVGFGSRKVGHIFLDRSSPKAALESLEEAKRKLVNGTSVVIFPEGTRSKTGKLIPFKRGAFKLATDLNLPLLPVTINGTRKIMPHPSLANILPGKASLTIHKPVEFTDSSISNLPELMKNIKETIESALD